MEVAVFDLLHEGFAFEEKAVETCAELARNDEELIVGDVAKGDGTAGGDKVSTPLKHEAGVPKDEESDERAAEG